MKHGEPQRSVSGRLGGGVGGRRSRAGSQPQDDVTGGLVTARLQVGRLARFDHHADVLAHEAPQLVPAQRAVAVGVRLAPEGPGERVAERPALSGGARLVRNRDLGDGLVLLAGREEAHVGELALSRLAGVGRVFRQIELQRIARHRRVGGVPVRQGTRARVGLARQGPGVAGVRDEDHPQILPARVQEPLVELVVDDPLAGPGPTVPEAAQDQVFVLPVFLRPGHALGLLRAVSGIGQHQRIARLGALQEVPPFGQDAIPGRRPVQQHREIIDTHPGKRLLEVPRVVHRPLELPDAWRVVVDADHEPPHRPGPCGGEPPLLGGG